MYLNGNVVYIYNKICQPLRGTVAYRIEILIKACIIIHSSLYYFRKMH